MSLHLMLRGSAHVPYDHKNHRLKYFLHKTNTNIMKYQPYMNASSWIRHISCNIWMLKKCTWIMISKCRGPIHEAYKIINCCYTFIVWCVSLWDWKQMKLSLFIKRKQTNKHLRKTSLRVLRETHRISYKNLMLLLKVVLDLVQFISWQTSAD